MEICEQALSNNLQSVDIFLYLAALYNSFEDKTTSVKYADKAKNLLTENHWYALSCVHSVLGEKEEALKYLELAVENDPQKKESAKTQLFLENIRNEPRERNASLISFEIFDNSIENNVIGLFIALAKFSIFRRKL